MSNTIHQIVVEGKFDKFLSDAKKALAETQRLGRSLQGVKAGDALNEFARQLKFVDAQTGKVVSSVTRLKNAMTKDLMRMTELGQSAAPMSSMDFGKLVQSRRVAYQGMKLSDSDIETLLSGYQAAQEQAIRNQDAEFARAVRSRQQQLSSRSKSIWKGFNVDGTLASDSRDVYAQLEQQVKSAKGNVVEAAAGIGRIRDATRRAIEQEIEKLKQDALTLGRAVKQSDVVKIQSSIRSNSEVLGAGKVARLEQYLAQAQRSVTETLRTRSVESLRKSIESEVKSAELTVKQLQQQLNRFREGSKTILTDTRSSMGREEFRQVLGTLIPQMKAEKEALHKAFRQPILNTLQNLTKQAQIDVEQLRSLRQMFTSVGGEGRVFTGESVAGIVENLKGKVSELMKSGSEFPRELVAYYAKLFRGVGESGAGLQTLVSYVKQQAASVNTHAEGVRIEQVKSQISKTLQEYNKAGQVLSDAIMQRLQRDFAALKLNTSFSASFDSELNVQRILRVKNEVKQAAEGIWKPLLAQLKSLDKLRLYEPSSYQDQIGPALLKQLEERYRSAIRAIGDQLKRGTGIDRKTAHSVLSEMGTLLDSIGVDVETQVYNNLNARFRNIRAQFKTVRGGDTSNLNSILREYQSLLKDIDASQDQELMNRAKRLVQYKEGVMAALARDDTLKRAEQMLRQGARQLGGTAALKVQLRGIKSAYEEIARSVEQVDKALAERLRKQSRELRQQALQNFNQRSGGRVGSGSGNGALGAYEMPEGMLRNYRRQLPMQITDIVVGLSTGQRLLYVILQQGGQLKDMFGGIGNAAKEVGKYLIGWKEGMSKAQIAGAALTRIFGGIALAAAAGFIALAKKASDFEQQMRGITVELKFSGTGLSGDDFREYTDKFSKGLGLAKSEAAALFKQIALDARLPKEAFEALATGIDDIAAALGKPINAEGLKETVDLLKDIFKDKDAFGEFASKYAIFTEEQYKAIMGLYDQKKASEAAALGMKYLAENTEGSAKEAMSSFRRETEEARQKLRDAFDTLSNSEAWNNFMTFCADATTAVVNFATTALSWINKVISGISDAGRMLDEASSANWATRALYGGSGSSETQVQVPVVVKPTFELDKAAADKAKGLVFGPDKMFRASEGVQGWRNFGYKVGSAAGAAASAAMPKGFKENGGFKVLQEAEKQFRIFDHNPEGKKGGGGRRGGGSRSRSSNDAQKDLERQQQYVQQLKEEWDLRSKMGKLEGLEYDRASGKLKLEGVYLEQARELARWIDERALAQEKMVLAEQRETQLLEHQIALQKELANAKIETFRYTGSDRTADYMQEIVNRDLELQGKLRKIQKDLANKIRRAVNDGKDEKYIAMLRADAAEQVELEKEIAAQNLAVWKQYYEERERLDKDWQAGYKKGVSQVIDWIYNIRSETASAVENWASGMADALAKFARTGKLSFKDLANSILDDIARIASRQFVSALFGGFQQGWTTVPQAQNGTAGMLKELVGKNAVQKVFVTNQGFSNFTSAASSFGEAADAIKQGFTLGGGTNLGLGSDPWGLSTVADRTVQEIGSAVTPAIKEGASGMFSGLFGKIGSIFSGIGSTISNLFKGFNFSSFGGGGGGFFSSLFSGIGGFFSSIFGSLFASGGYTGAGGKYTPAGIVHAGEYVINAASTRKLGLDFLNRLNGYASGGYVSAKPSIVSSGFAKDAAPMEVNIYNNGDNQVRTQRNNTGGLDIFIEQAVNAVAGSIVSGGTVASAMQQTYALNRGSGLQRSGY